MCSKKTNKIIKYWAYEDKHGNQVIGLPVWGNNKAERVRNQLSTVKAALEDDGSRVVIRKSEKNKRRIDLGVSYPNGRVGWRCYNMVNEDEALENLIDEELIEVDTLNGDFIISQNGDNCNYVGDGGIQYRLKAGTRDELEEVAAEDYE